MLKARLSFSRLYVPICTLLLVFVTGNWLVNRSTYDPMTAAQNPRITFQNKTILTGSNTIKELKTKATKDELSRDNGLYEGPALLYLGNSQLLGIMDATAGDMTAPDWLQFFLAHNIDSGVRVIKVYNEALPNLTMIEFLVKLVSFAEESTHKTDALVAEIALEEFRDLSVRDEISESIKIPEVKSALQYLVINNSDLPEAVAAISNFLNKEKDSTSIDQHNNMSLTIVDKAEMRIQKIFDRLPLFAKRRALRDFIGINYFFIRNKLLGITTSTLRPVPDAAYQTSLQLLELVLRYTNSKKVYSIVYLSPMRLTPQPNSNRPSDVVRFRRDVPTLCQRCGIKCFDYTDLIPEKMWTNYPDDPFSWKGQRDFAHFTGPAHRLLVETLMNDIGFGLRNFSKQ